MNSKFSSRLFRLLTTALLAAATSAGNLLAADAPLRVFIRGGVKTHGPNQHDHPRFLADWTKLLAERGLKSAGSMTFPTAEQLEATDVLVIYAADGMKIVGDERARFENFLKRGGGVVVIHDAVVADDQNEWCKRIIGGTWIWPAKAPGHTATTWHEGPVGIYFVDEEHPITRGISNFDWKDEVYNRMEMEPDVRVLATSFVDVFNIHPQLWTYEKTLAGGTRPYRAFVSIPGHEYDVFNTPHYRAILLRGIAWAGGRTETDQYCTKEELASLRYPAGGPIPGAQAVKNFQLHPEFNISLTADEKVAEKIMSMEWDPTGRLWVVETPEYPGGRDINRADASSRPYRNLEPDKFPVGGKELRKPKDRVSILEDTNGDGVMDKRTVFADGLELPTSLVLYKDGVIVSQAPDILWIRDTNGDGKADKTEVLYTGWGTTDTHAVINNLRWGPDGWVYGTVGYTRGRNVRSPLTGKNFGDFSAGVYRFRPDGMAMEQVAAEGCNTWGVEIAPDGEIVFTTATCGEPICHVIIPETVLARGSVGGIKAYKNIIEENKIYPPFKETRQPYVQIDWVGAWTAAAGACIYDGGAWPAKWAPDDRYSFFMSEATMHLFHHEFLDPNGVTYQGRKEEGRKETEFLGSTDYWFRPIHSRVGPDGAIYVVDFYNQIAVHNDTRGPAHGARNAAARPDRDHHFTRIYRVQHKDAIGLPAHKLDAKDPDGLVKMLDHPNGWVRATANRLLNETQPAKAVPALTKLATTSPSRYGRIQGLFALNNLGKLDDRTLLTALQDKDPAVRKNAARLAGDDVATSPEKTKAVEALLNDANGRARINAIIALGNFPPSRDIADAIAAAWPSLKDPYLESAAIGAASRDPLLYLAAIFSAPDPAMLAGFVPHLARLTANRQDATLAARFVAVLARQPAATDGLKRAALEALTAALRADIVPAWSDEVGASLKSLLGGDQTAGSVLPLVARWDTDSKLADDVKPAVIRAEKQLTDKTLSDATRGQVAANLVGLRKLDPTIVPAVSALIGGENSSALQQRVIEALGSQTDTAGQLIILFPKLTIDLVEPAFGQILKRAETTRALLTALADKKIDVARLGPTRQHRLRTHPDLEIARRANQVIDDLKGPEAKEKAALIAKLRPEVVKPGNAENGHKLFTANCAGCHIFKTEGRNLAPNLTGMGAHGPADLLVHIVDPNLLVEPNFVSTAIETKDDQAYDGIIDRENAQELVLRNATGDITIRKSDIKTRSSSGRSLMPEGFEQLGPDGLRDLLTYICADESRYRLIDLSAGFTANNSRGLYQSAESTNESVRFRTYGTIKADDVPYDVVSPTKAVANVIVLKGGSRDSWSKKNVPQKVEVPVGVAAARLHFLGGVAGWGYPAVSDRTLAAAKITLYFVGGATQEIILKNGVEIADYNGTPDVPGSKLQSDLIAPRSRGTVRTFSKDVTNPAVIERMTIESYDNSVAPTFFAVTAELPGAAGSTPRPATAAAAPSPAPAVFNWGAGIKTLIVGGGSSHDFMRFFNLADKETLENGGFASVNYTEDFAAMAANMKMADVLVYTTNKEITDADQRKALLDHLAAGKGMVVIHAGAWYNQKSWPEFNTQLLGGGSRGHDRLGEFEVTVTAADHPVMKGVPTTFTITDELYNNILEPAGSPIEVLSTSKSPLTGKVFPSVFVVKNATARIVVITLGHDARAHSLDAYKALLRNSVQWVQKRN